MGLFECRIPNTNVSARAICTAVDTWHDTGNLQAGTFEPELIYFRNRYYPHGHFSHRYEGLRLQRLDRSPLVRSVLDGSDNDPAIRVSGGAHHNLSTPQ